VIVALYLAAIVAANLAIASFGPAAAIPVAFLFVGLDLTARDRLHDAWQGRHLAVRMALLIATGGVLSWLLNRDAAQIAVASTVAFVGAAVADGIVYQLVRDRPWAVRVNASNIAGAAVDSLLFPTLAFGALLPLIVLGQFAAKVLGGFAWSLLLGSRR
jgi:hypothetical protein